MQVTVANAKEARIQRFLCRESLGREAQRGAVLLTPARRDQVVYGSGDQAQLLTQVRSVARCSLATADTCQAYICCAAAVCTLWHGKSPDSSWKLEACIGSVSILGNP